MAEPLGVGASIIAVLHLTTTVFQYINDVSDANEERSRLRDCIASACTPLYILRDRLDEAKQDPTWLSSVRSLSGPNGPLDQYKALLEKVVSKLGSRDGRRSRLDQLRKRIVWPFQKEEFEAMLRAVESQKSLFHLALQNDTL